MLTPERIKIIRKRIADLLQHGEIVQAKELIRLLPDSELEKLKQNGHPRRSQITKESPLNLDNL